MQEEEQIISEAQQAGLDIEDSEFKRFVRTFNLSDAKQQVIALGVIKYITRQLNADTLRGILTFMDYRFMAVSSMKGLFKLIFLENYDENQIRQEIIYRSSKNFMMLLFTRPFGGKDYALLKAEIEARKPTVIQR